MSAPSDEAAKRRLQALLDQLEPDELPEILDFLQRKSDVTIVGASHANQSVAPKRFFRDLDSTGAASRPGRLGELGGFRLLEVLGQGGMGTVYRGERVQGDFVQIAAVKVLHLGAQADPLATQRFARERRILASLRHPNIASFIDGGNDQGQLWFAMELIAGQHLGQYCEQNRLSLRERVALVLQACEAVAFAHRLLIVHRDIKPSNVLVDQNGQIKLLDFGIAKLLHETEEALTLSRAPYTPRYAAPEQHNNGDVGTSTDVYQLGALLFELCSGLRYRRRGHDAPTMSSALQQFVAHGPQPTDELMQADWMSEVEQQRALQSRGFSHTRELAAALKGDLDAIVERALRYESKERYPGAAELAADLRAHLQHRPIQARRHTAWRVFILSIRRHKIAAAAIATSVVVLLASTLFSMHSARQERLNLERANRLKALLMETFSDADPIWSTAGANDVPAVLSGIGARIAKADELPVVDQIDLLLDIGATLDNFGRGAQAEPTFRSAEALARAHPHTQRLGKVLTHLGGNAFNRSDSQHAAEIYAQARALLGAQQPPDLETQALLHFQYATLHQSNREFEASEREALAAVEKYRQSQGEGGRGTAHARIMLARAQAHVRSHDVAIKTLETAQVQRAAQTKGAPDPMLGAVQTNLCFMYDAADQVQYMDFCLEHAERYARDFPQDLFNVGEGYDAAARLLRRGKRLDQAIATFGKALAVEADNPDAAGTQAFLHNELARTHLLRRDFQAALSQAQTALAIHERLFGPQYHRSLRSRVIAASALYALDQKDAARALITGKEAQLSAAGGLLADEWNLLREQLAAK